MKKSNEEKTYATLKLGKTYKFAGYNWMACEVDNDCHVVVIQSHGVTHGAWPGYTMPQFGNGNYYPIPLMERTSATTMTRCGHFTMTSKMQRIKLLLMGKDCI